MSEGEVNVKWTDKLKFKRAFVNLLFLFKIKVVL